MNYQVHDVKHIPCVQFFGFKHANNAVNSFRLDFIADKEAFLLFVVC